jgi:SAM-dependent methyltransferase
MPTQDPRTFLSSDQTHGLGDLTILHPQGTFGITPASLISIEALGVHQAHLKGIGLDWGAGTGCLAILASRIPKVDQVIGLDISERDIEIARENALLNGASDKVSFIRSDSYTPFSPDDSARLGELEGKVSFIVSNPPSSENDDGFGYRREVLRGARDFLTPGGIVLLNISYQYGVPRIQQLAEDQPEFVHNGVIATTDWVPFDLSRRMLLDCLERYVEEENGGGFGYEFAHPGEPDQPMNTSEALSHYQESGESPLSRWQTHLFELISRE